MPLRTVIAGSEQLGPLRSVAVRLPDGADAFVVRLPEGGFSAFLNRCPHWNVDLDMGLGEFVDPAIGLIVCRNHGAEFAVDSGLCLHGPCAGDRLCAVPFERDDEGRAVLLTDPW